MRRVLHLIFAVLLLIPAMAQAEGKWNNIDNMSSAYQRFLQTQQDRGNDEVRAQTAQCYRQARAVKDSAQRFKELEYCIAFDVANIEYTTAFYSQLEKRYKQKQSLQPEETTRSAGQGRILDELTAANIDDQQKIADMMYKTSALFFIEFLKFEMSLNKQYSESFDVSGSVWSGVDSHGDEYEYHFNRDGSLYYKSPTGFWKNGTWKQDKRVIYMETNSRYSEYRGLITDKQMEGGAWNIRGMHWSWVAKRVKE